MNFRKYILKKFIVITNCIKLSPCKHIIRNNIIGNKMQYIENDKTVQTESTTKKLTVCLSHLKKLLPSRVLEF